MRTPLWELWCTPSTKSGDRTLPNNSPLSVSRAARIARPGRRKIAPYRAEVYTVDMEVCMAAHMEVYTAAHMEVYTAAHMEVFMAVHMEVHMAAHMAVGQEVHTLHIIKIECSISGKV